MSLTPSSSPEINPEQPVIAESANDKFSTGISLDVLRGIALLALLITGIWEFGGFNANQQAFYRNGPHGGNFKLYAAVSILIEGKMMSLLALVAGAGIVLFMQKKERPVSLPAADAYIRRQIWLLIFGVFNAFILLWPGDILFPFAVAGILIFAFWRLPAKGLFIGAIVCTLIYCGKQYWNYCDDKKDYKKFLAVSAVEKKFKEDSTARFKKDSIDKTKDPILFKDTLIKNKLADSLAKKNDTLTKKQAEEKGKWEGIAKAFKFDSSAKVAENKAVRSRYGKVWNHLMVRSQYKESQWFYKIGVWEIASMMFLGMALLNIGFFSSRFSSSKYLLIGSVAVIAGIALGWFRIHFNSLSAADYAKYVEQHAIPFNQFLPLEKMLLAAGYASLMLWLLRMNILKWLMKTFAATGRMALTNYIMQSVICSFFFYGYGFGYFGRLQQWELYFMVAEITLVQVAFSIMWLRYYNMGPLEWLWQCLIYRKRLPWKKQQTTNPTI